MGPFTIITVTHGMCISPGNLTIRIVVSSLQFCSKIRFYYKYRGPSIYYIQFSFFCYSMLMSISFIIIFIIYNNQRSFCSSSDQLFPRVQSYNYSMELEFLHSTLLMHSRGEITFKSWVQFSWTHVPGQEEIEKDRKENIRIILTTIKTKEILPILDPI